RERRCRLRPEYNKLRRGFNGMTHSKPVPEPNQLREAMEKKQSVLEATRLAYLHRTPIHGEIPDYEALQRAATEFIEANYALQRALFGKVRVKLSVARRLR